jgi:hypothetical protein
MVLVRFAVAVSAIALSAGAAQAQQNTNASDVSQTGTDNILVIDNARAGNDQNRSSVIQNGTSNRATVIQIGDFNESLIRQIGDRNITAHTETGDFNRAESVQEGDDHGSAIRQRGLSNSAVVEQLGTRLRSQIAQGEDLSATEDFSFAQFYDTNLGVARSGNDNRVSVSQIGTDLSSTLRQRAAANSSASADSNNARIIQRGNGNSSSVVQESRGNIAEVFQFQGGNTTTLRNQTSVAQRNSAATSASNPLSNNRASVSVAGQTNSSTVSQDGLNNNAEVTQGLGQSLGTTVTQRGSGASNLARVAQYGDTNSVTVVQDSVAARADVWQQAGPAGARSANNRVEIQQGSGTTGTDAFSAAFFGNTAPTGAATRNLVADVVQGNNPNAASWNVAQVRQDGVDLTAIVRQAGTGTSALPNIVRIAQQGGAGGANRATAIQGAGVGPSAAGDPASGQAGDDFFFAGGARSAELNILQSGSTNSATIEQRGRGQFARIEQGPGTGNTASILQDVAATNATAIIQQTGSNNSYDVVQTSAGQYVRVRQTGNNNAVTDVVQRP